MSRRTAPTARFSSLIPGIPAGRCVELETAPASPLAAMERWSAELDLRAIVATHGSNLWIVSESQLVENLAAWTRVVGDASRVLYPVKANPSPAVLEILAARGARAECASAAEILLARLAGFGDGRIVYGSPAPELEVAWRVLSLGGTVVVDSVEFLAALEARAAEAPDTARRGAILLRVNPSIDIRYRRDESWSELTSHAKKTGKFGIPSEETVAAARLARRLRLVGLHAHAGTQMDHLAPFTELAAHLDGLARAIEAETTHTLAVLDLGGGLGIPFHDGDAFPSIEAFGSALGEARATAREIWVEPGHALVGNAVALLGSVVATKSVRGRRWAILDIGTDQLAKITLLNWRHQMRGPDGRAMPTSGNDSLGGPLCFSGDTLLPATDVSGLAAGDPVLVQHAGAYCAALASTFNGRRAGGTLVVRLDGSIERTGARATTLDEPLARTHAWGSAAPEPRTAAPIALDAIAPLSSKVLREDLCDERFAYRSATSLGPRAFEYEFDVSSPVGFVSMPLAIRLAGDAAIVSTLRMLGYETKAFPVWGTSLELRMGRQIPTSAPVRVRIELSHAATRGEARSKQLAVRFAIDGDAATGAFEIKFDERGEGC